jgi:hypothetical protein
MGWHEIPTDPPDPGMWIMRDSPLGAPPGGKMPFPIQKRVLISVDIIREALSPDFLSITPGQYSLILDKIPA